MRYNLLSLFFILVLGYNARAQSHLADFKVSKDTLCTSDSLIVTYTGNAQQGTASASWIFQNGNPAGSFSWGPFKIKYTNPAITDSIILIVNNNGAGTADTIDTVKVAIFVKLTPVAHFVFNSAGGCAFNNVTATANGSASGSAIYNWSFPGAISDSGKGTGPVYATYDTGWHKITLVINDNGCLSSPYSDSIYFDSLPKPSFTAKLLRGCIPMGDSFINLSTNAVAYQWKFGDSTISGNTSPYHIYTMPGYKTVRLIATSSKGCIDSFTIPNYINVVGQPVANFNADPLDNSPIQLRNGCVTFYDQSTYANHYKWNFGDTMSSKIDSLDRDTSTLTPKTTHCFKVVGQYSVCLYSYNYIGCVDSVCHLISIIPNNEVFIPNTFTPNGDARDDRWQVFGNDIDRVDMKIFDRWGELVFYSADFYAGWDGTYNNKPANTGVYSYIATVYRTNNRIEHYKGGVTLIR